MRSNQGATHNDEKARCEERGGKKKERYNKEGGSESEKRKRSCQGDIESDRSKGEIASDKETLGRQGEAMRDDISETKDRYKKYKVLDRRRISAEMVKMIDEDLTWKGGKGRWRRDGRRKEK
ncbi:hypothetical protein KM043_013180 [Ampulex compressa]|nr:hypothetical protein KM043_013180 [Ampulex compressa]